jgi:glutathione S-transferase
MTTPEILGAPQSTFVRTVRMACAEKGVAYTLTPARPHSPEVNAIHPFGKIPVFRHDAVTLCESRAICGYVDLAFPGPPLVPRDAIGASHCEQWISLVNTVIAPTLTGQYLQAYFFSGLPDGAPDRARIDAVLPKLRDIFSMLERELSARQYLAGDGFTLADTYLLPLVYYLRLLPESGELLAASPRMTAWYDSVIARPSAADTAPPPMPGRG